ncbi:hypothetical protein G9C85_02465 [Halorubellus sp. JP-L1]|uniref:hypothetical protein n=1 Tax=Halorubellus sp. JP-L1 TaxID=2715753 RepID=UPI00140E2CA4|nr:hypothetical protein [Halorubellus sp. JP-L1]NHN40501.1 hypothetical protein [Halorubellus sp. JP-L1]
MSTAHTPDDSTTDEPDPRERRFNALEAIEDELREIAALNAPFSARAQAALDDLEDYRQEETDE